MRSIPSPQKKAASAVYLTLAALVFALAALVVFEAARGRRLVLEVSEMGGDPHAPGAQAVVGAVTVFAVLIMLVAATAVAAAVAYLNWLLRARRGAYRSRSPVAPVLAGWFAPVANLVVPAVLVDRLWLASRPPAGRRPRWLALLAAWWLSWLTALALVLARLWPGGAHGSAELTGIGPAELAAVTVAALLCAATVREITVIQTASARHRRRGPAARTAPESSPETAPPARRGALRLLPARPFLWQAPGDVSRGTPDQNGAERVSSANH
ncbi:hypothetical protein GCM10010517_66710 [Streptosporangium fragile]|uniref:DUF4328 domain-containing protein n=1 Tax=Streptosporangium fragile TaxID=46186 RepID=A0ABN3W7V1_9ACTN